MPAPHSLALELRFARSRLLIVEPATALQRDPRPAVRQNKKHLSVLFLFCGGGTGTRTLDPLIKSQLLYQLSYASKTDFYRVRGKF